ncbi:MAG: hypothetical protein KAG66_05315, partial [Methylococcales bacterium]|nr:hypothetical protein [Methylococcales bacterium]
SPPPIVKISVNPGQEVAEGAEVTLDGSGSTGDGSLTYLWEQKSSDLAQVALNTNGPADPKATFTAPKVGLAGINLEFTLIVSDSKNLQTPATVKIAVKNDPTQNAIPIADAGSGIQADQGTEVTLPGGNSSDEDGDDTIVSYTWTQDPQDVIRVVLVNDPATPNATFIAPAVVKELAPNGVYILHFELVVEDNEGARSKPARVVANVVLGVNVLGESKSLPVADAGPDQTVAPGAVVQLDGSASQGQAGATDGSSSIVSYLWASEDPEVIFSDPAAVDPTFTVPGDLANGSQLALTLQVINSDGLIDIDEVVVSVGENPPVVEAGEPRTVGKGSTVTLTGAASDNGRI